MIPGSIRNLSICHHDQTDSEIHPVSYPVCNGALSPAI